MKEEEKSSGKVTDIDPFVFKSTCHQRYENGRRVRGLQECMRTVSVEKNINGCQGYKLQPGLGYIVKIFNDDLGRPQMSDKPMTITEKTADRVELRGYPIKAQSPFGWMDVDYQDYGLTVYYKDGMVTRCVLHMFDRNVDLEYGRVDEEVHIPQNENGKGLLNGHEYVDLGLSVKWATCNVGANSSEDYGDYFAWGETETKKSYDEENCETFWEDISDIKGTDRDVAHVRWGSPWRMPTKAEFDELLKNCDWEWTTLDGMNGYKVTGRNGNSIFLSAAGWRDGTSLYYAGVYGLYWSSTPYGYDSRFAYGLDFGSGYLDWDRGYRNLGISVRPVSEF